MTFEKKFDFWKKLNFLADATLGCSKNVSQFGLAVRPAIANIYKYIYMSEEHYYKNFVHEIRSCSYLLPWSEILHIVRPFQELEIVKRH